MQKRQGDMKYRTMKKQAIPQAIEEIFEKLRALGGNRDGKKKGKVCSLVTFMRSSKKWMKPRQEQMKRTFGGRKVDGRRFKRVPRVDSNVHSSPASGPKFHGLNDHVSREDEKWKGAFFDHLVDYAGEMGYAEDNGLLK